MRGLIAFALSMVAASGAYAACPGTLTDCPSPSFNNVTVGGTLSAPVSGDLGGTLPAPTVAKIQGEPVAATPAPTTNQVLQWNGTAWAPANSSAGGGPPSGNATGDLSGTYPAPTVAKIQGNPVASTPAPTSGQFLSWNGSSWVPVNPPQGSAANPGGSSNQVQINSGGTTFGGVPFGNAGQVLVSQGSSAAPSFVDPVVSAIAGGFADGAITTQGSKADAPNCATGNTEIACLRQLDADVKGSISAGSAIIGGINNFPTTVDTNAGAPTVNTIRTMPATGATMATYAGTLTLTALDVSTVTTGGTAVTALTAGHRAKGGWIKNPDAATAALCINEIGTASGTTTSGSTICIAAGQSYQLAPSGNTVSVIASDANHAFGGYGFQ